MTPGITSVNPLAQTGEQAVPATTAAKAKDIDKNMFLQLLVLGLVAHCFFGKRRRANLVCGAATACAAMVGFLAVNFHTLLYWMLHGWKPEPSTWMVPPAWTEL